VFDFVNQKLIHKIIKCFINRKINEQLTKMYLSPKLHEQISSDNFRYLDSSFSRFYHLNRSNI